MKKSIRHKQIRVRCWVDVDGRKFFGPGRAELLRLIEETGSIAESARLLGMSYKKAWSMVSEMNEVPRHPYVVTQKGGESGGGTRLTASGQKVLKAYLLLARRVSYIVEKDRDLLKFI